jgi:hypothetical protein
MKKIHLALSALVATLAVLLCNISMAYADIACPSGGAPPCHGPPTGGGGGGGGCSIAMAHPSGTIAFVMVAVGLTMLAVSRRRKA